MQNSNKINLTLMFEDTNIPVPQLKYFLGLPITAVCTASTIDDVLGAYQQSENGSEAEIAASIRLDELVKLAVSEITTSEAAKILAKKVEYCSPESAVSLYNLWLNLCTNIPEVTEFYPDSLTAEMQTRAISKVSEILTPEMKGEISAFLKVLDAEGIDPTNEKEFRALIEKVAVMFYSSEE